MPHFAKKITVFSGYNNNSH